MMKELGEALGRRIEWWRMPFEHLLPAVEAGDVDVVCATIGVTPERAERMAFTRPYYRTTIAVVVRAGPGEPTELADLAGRRVAAGTGTTSERAVRAHLPDAIGVFATERELPTSERLLAREIDAAAMDGPAAAALVAASEGRLARLAEPLDEELYALAVPLRRKSLLRALDRALERIDLDALDARHGL
jgi:polar amino acid transport system substrate-binding protein